MTHRYRGAAIGTASILCGLVLSACGGDQDESLPVDSSAVVTTPTSAVDEEIAPTAAPDTGISPGPASTSGAVGFEERGDERYEPADRAEALAFAEAIGANLMVVRLDYETILTWNAGAIIESPSSGMEYVYSDGSFLYRWAGEGGGTLQATASTLDGVVICKAAGRIHHATKRSDGSYVVAVERDLIFEEDLDGLSEFAHPLDAVDCQTGDKQPIEPVMFYEGDGQYRFTERLSGRVFTGYGDAEGNADVLNERGISINGDDYAGYHTFNADASLVAYGDMGAGAGPHLSPVVVVRDTNSGERLASVRFDEPFMSLAFVDDRLVVTLPEDLQAMIGGVGSTAGAVVLDPATGERLDEIEAGFDLIYLG